MGEREDQQVQHAISMQSTVSRRIDFKNLVGHLQRKTMSAASNGTSASPNENVTLALSFIDSLKVCAREKDLQRGSHIHRDIAKSRLLDSNIYVGNTLISMYSKCGAIDKAQQVFDQLPLPNTVSWNALMLGYAQNGHDQKALSCYESMELTGCIPDAFTFVCSLKACGNTGDLKKGEEIHHRIAREFMLDTDILVANALIGMYAQCAAFGKALEVFDKLPLQAVGTWTAIIAGYLRHEHFGEALGCFRKMQSDNLFPDAPTFANILKGCGRTGALDEGQEIHALVVREEVLGKDILVSNALVGMYAKCGALNKAQGLFDELPKWDKVSWNALMTGYTHHSYYEEVLRCLDQMQKSGYFPDEVTYMCALKACGSMKCLDKGQEIHSHIVTEGLLEKHVVLANALLDMYVKCGIVDKAQEVFDELTLQDVVSWNTLISGYAQHGQGKEALNCFSQMLRAGISPDSATFACILSACGSIRALDKGKELHTQLLKEYQPNKHIVAGYALVDMYAKCGALQNAREVFEELPVRNLIVWTALIAGYAENMQANEAFNCLEHLQLEGFSPDAFTFSCTLKACGSIGAVEKGQNIHNQIVIQGSVENDRIIGATLLDMYACCGMIDEAQDSFDKSPARDVTTWSALMVGYAQLGQGEIVLILFDRMTREGMEPDGVTFTIVLNMCSRRGLLSKGQTYFEIMTRRFGFMPNLKHYNCMVDLFGRAGHLDKAVTILSRSSSFSFATWQSVLTACRSLDNSNLGKWAFENALQVSQKSSVCRSLWI